MQDPKSFFASSDLHRCLDGAMLRLASIWDQIGFENELRKKREAIVLKFLSDLLEDMVKEEDQLRQKLLDNIQKFSVQLFNLTQELHLPVYEPDDKCSIINLEKELKEKLKVFETEREGRLKRLQLLKTADEHLARRLGLGAFHIGSGVVPSLQQLETLEKHLKELENEQEKRWKQFCDVRKETMGMLHDLDMKADQSVVQNVSESPDSVSLTTDSLERLGDYHNQLERLLSANKVKVSDLWIKVKALWTRLDLPDDEIENFEDKITNYSNRAIDLLKGELVRCEQLKLANIQIFIVKLQEELTTWWDRCFVLNEHRMTFKPFSEEPASEDLLSRHEMELQTVKSYYEQNKDVLEKVARWHKFWQEFLALERKASNPDRFNNRGGKLLKEEKARKKLAIELPKIEQEVAAQIDEEEKSSGRQFLISGLSFRDYVQRERDGFTAEKENEKLSRQQQKAKQIEEEAMYGSRPVTPGLKRLPANTTPSKNTPNKIRKVDISKASGSIYGSQRNLTNLFSPGLVGAREKFGASIPRGLNNAGLEPKTPKTDFSRINGKAFTSVSSGISSSVETIYSGKSGFSGKASAAANCDRGSELKQKKKTEPYF